MFFLFFKKSFKVTYAVAQLNHLCLIYFPKTVNCLVGSVHFSVFFGVTKNSWKLMSDVKGIMDC